MSIPEDEGQINELILSPWLIAWEEEDDARREDEDWDADAEPPDAIQQRGYDVEDLGRW